MCYFVEINLSRQELKKRFGVSVPEDPRYMPSSLFNAFNKPYLPVITSDRQDEVQFFQWGLIPSWTKNPEMAEKIKNSTFNARSESIFEKPSFRKAANSGRCMVLVHGFYEWHTKGNLKIPYYISRKDGEAFSLAGLYDEWTNRDSGEILPTLSIITTRANPMMEKIHNTKKRMPVILSENNEKDFIEAGLNRKQVESFLVPADEKEFNYFPVNKKHFLSPLGLIDPLHTKPDESLSSENTGELF